ncbi:transporter substrate-binding domain-containing protein [Micromonospora sp. NPDC049559]|uniref:transporter substrate-binding domain-containing protein n=1 Tax=Micromonospora sp. NPDC049559 TaxID=3155923 RepID=UPI0034415F00
MRALPQRFGRLIYVTALAVVIGVLAGLSGGSLYNLVSRQMRANDQLPSVLRGPAVQVVVSDTPGFAAFKDGTFAGFDIELVDFLAADAKVRPVYVPSAPFDKLAMLQSGMAHLGAGVVITEERRRLVDLVGPYLISHDGVMTRADDGRIDAAADLDGKRVCAPMGTTTAADAQSGQVRVEIKSLAACVESLLAGQVEAVAADELSLRSIVKARPKDLKVIGDIEFGSSLRYGIALSPGHAADCRELARALREFILSDRWEESFKAHFGPQADAARFRPDPNQLEHCPSA